MRQTFSCFAAVFGLICGSSVAQTVTEFRSDVAVTSIVRASDGEVWCSTDHSIRKYDPSGLIAEFPAPYTITGGLVVDRGGTLWFLADKDGFRLARMTPGGDFSDAVLTPQPNFGSQLVLATDGTFWMNGSTSSGSPGLLHLTPAGAVTYFPVPAPGAVAPAPDGGAWFVVGGGSVVVPDLGTAAPELRRISPDGAITAYPQTRGAQYTRLDHLKVAHDGTLWASSGDILVHLDPKGERTEVNVPGFTGKYYYPGINDLEPAPDGSVWFLTGWYSVGTGLHPNTSVVPARVGRLSPDGVVTQFDRPTTWGSKELTVASDGAVWFWDVKINLASAEAVLVRVASEGCRSDVHARCLNADRFRAQIGWRTIDGTVDLGTATSLTTDTAAFWFFSPNNIESVVKVVDGRAVNGHFWVFIAALTNVEWEVTVLDTETGVARRYSNPQGMLQSLADTAAF